MKGGRRSHLMPGAWARLGCCCEDEVAFTRGGGCGGSAALHRLAACLGGGGGVRLGEEVSNLCLFGWRLRSEVRRANEGCGGRERELEE